MKRNFIIPCCIVLVVLLSSFLKEKNGIKELPKIVRSNYALIPNGKVFVGRDSAEVGSFYILKTEVDNVSYREFINDIKKNGRQEELAIAFVDTQKWQSALVYNQPYIHYYFGYKAYDFYPVVNVSYEGATLYCKWLTDKLNQTYSRNFIFEVRLPTRTEWMRAAQLDERNFVYAWGGPYLANSRGQQLCNYKHVGDERIHTDSIKNNYLDVNGGILNNGADITAPVKSFYPNRAGVYNMNGNAAEMVAEKGIAVGGSWNSTGYDVRNESIMNYTEPSPLIGFRPVLIIKAK